MPPETTLQLTVRDALLADVPALTSIKGRGTEAIHRDRLCDAQKPGFRYLVLQMGSEVIAHACLVFTRPVYWSDGADTTRLPQIVDLQVKESLGGQGYGTEFIRHIETITAHAGHAELYLSVEPRDNPRAHALYLRLGYRQLQDQPHYSTWEFTDSEGVLHRGEDWCVDMVKTLVE